jgi:hypothetical protein
MHHGVNSGHRSYRVAKEKAETKATRASQTMAPPVATNQTIGKAPCAAIVSLALRHVCHAANKVQLTFSAAQKTLGRNS